MESPLQPVKSRSTLWLVLGVAIAIGLAAIAIALINLDAYLNSQKQWLEETTSRLLARDVSFERIGVSIRGGLGVRLTKPRIGDDPAYSDEAFLSADAIEVRIGLWAALNGEVEIRSATLVAPVLRVQQAKQGWNFDSLGESSARESEAPEVEQDEPGAREILIALFEVSNGTLHYTNSTGESPYSIEAQKIESSASEWRPGESFEFEARAAMHGADSHNTTIVATLHPNDGDGPAVIDLDLKLIAHESAQLIELAPIAALLPADFTARGPLHAELKLTGPTDQLAIEARVDVEEVALSSDAFDKPAGAPLDVQLVGTLNDEALEVSDLVLRAANLSLRSKARLLRTQPATLDFEVHSDQIPMQALGLHRELVPEESVEYEVLKNVRASGRLTLVDGATGKIAFQSSSGFLRGVDYESLAVDIDLEGDRVRAAFRSPKGGIGRFPLAKLELDMLLEGGRLQLERGSVEILGGQLHAKGQTQTLDSVRHSQLEAKLMGARAEALDAVLNPNSKQNAEGLLTARVSLAGRGASWEELKNTLEATGAIRIEEGVLNSVNLAQGAIDAIVGVPGLSAIFSRSLRESNPQIFDSSETEFETIDIGIRLADGVAQTEQIEIRTSGYKIVGQGSITLDGEVDAHAILTFSQSFTKRLGLSGKLLAGVLNPAGLLAIPLRIVGTLPDIETQADPAYIARALQKGLLQDPIGLLLGGADAVLDSRSWLEKR